MECGRKERETATSTKGNMWQIRNKGMGYLLGRLGMFTKDIICKIYVKTMVRCFGPMEVTTKAIGRAGFRMEKA